MGLLGLLLRGVLWGSGGLLSLAVLLLAVLWGLHESSALKPGRGVDVPNSLWGTNAIITGSSAGIGFETALQLYELGAHVIIHSSSQKRANKSADAIRKLAYNWGGEVTALAADLGDFDQVVAFSKKLPTVMPRVHLFFLNAAMLYGLGAMYDGADKILQKPASDYQAKSGHDTCMAVNHLGHYLMTLLLLPQLAPKATIVVMSSAGAWSSSHTRLMPPWGKFGDHKFNKHTSTQKRIRWEVGGLKKSGNVAYKDTKLANVCFARWLRRQLGGNYTVVIHDPGFVNTAPGLDRESRAYQERLYRRTRSKVFWKWHAPSVDGGTHMLQSAFITRRPVPDWVASYFFPEQVTSWFSGYAWEDYGRGRLAHFSFIQKLTWGLHGSVGPQCDEDLQDRFMAWSADQVGAKQPFPRRLGYCVSLFRDYRIPAESTLACDKSSGLAKMVTDRQADRRRHNPSSHSTASVDTLEATIRQYLEGSSVETHHTSLEKKKHGGILGELENLESNFEHLAFGDRRTAITRKTAPKPDAQWSTFRRACYKVTESGIYNVGMVFIILLNVVHLVQETDLRSQKVDSPPFMVIISRTFLVIYLVDLLLRAFVLRRAFFKSGMNVFDAMVVVVDTVLTILPGPLSGLPSMSVLRGLRMLRIVRVIRNLVAFRELYLMMQGLVSAVRAIIFGAGLIVAVLILWSVLAVELVQEENLRLFEEGAYGDCTRCEHAFETVGASMLTFTSTIVAGDSWGRLALPLIESRPWTMLIILPALLSLELGLLNVVAAVIVDRQTQARQDDEKFLHQMRDEELKKSYSRLKCLFASMDDDGSGSLTLEELIESYKFHAEFKELMELMDIGEDDLHLVFSILDKDRSGDVSYNEFVEQLNTMRSTNSHTLLVFIKHLAHRLSEQVDFQSASIEHLSCSLGLEPLKKDNGQGAVGIDADQWYEEVSQEVSEKPRGSKAPAAAEADPKPQSSAWFVRAGPSSLCGGSAASAAAADLNKRFLALSQHVQSSLAAITEDAVRQAGDGVLWESTLALATLQASMPLLHRPAGHRQAPARGPWEELAAGPRRLSVRNSRPGPAGATCPRVRPLKLQARGGPAAAGGSAQDRSSSGPIPLELPVGPRKATRGGRSLPRDTGNLRR